MTTVRVQPTANGMTYTLTCTRSPNVTRLIKTLPWHHRRWDKVASCWRVKAARIAELIGLLEINGHLITGGPDVSGATRGDRGRWGDRHQR